MKVLLSPISWLLLGLLCLLAPQSAAAQSGPATRTLYLVRHGSSDYNDRDDKTGNPLLPLGREQAAMVADRLAGFSIKFSSIKSSEFTRARETGDIIGAQLGLACLRDGLLNECTPTGAGVALKPEHAEADAQLARAWRHYATPDWRAQPRIARLPRQCHSLVRLPRPRGRYKAVEADGHLKLLHLHHRDPARRPHPPAGVQRRFPRAGRETDLGRHGSRLAAAFAAQGEVIGLACHAANAR